jgi:hypothetical protein
MTHRLTRIPSRSRLSLLSQKTRVGIGLPDDRRIRAIRGAFLLPLNGGLCEASERMAGTYPGRPTLYSPPPSVWSQCWRSPISDRSPL